MQNIQSVLLIVRCWLPVIQPLLPLYIKLNSLGSARSFTQSFYLLRRRRQIVKPIVLKKFDQKGKKAVANIYDEMTQRYVLQLWAFGKSSLLCRDCNHFKSLHWLSSLVTLQFLGEQLIKQLISDQCSLFVISIQAYSSC